MSLKRFVVNDIESDQVVLTLEEHNHLKNVLRLSVGDKVVLTCGDGYDYLGEIEQINKQNSLIKVLSKSKNMQDPRVNITVFSGLLKGENMSLVVQKLSELGVLNLYPFESEFTISKNSSNKRDRLQKIADQSTKQCRRSVPLCVHDVIKFSDVVKHISAGYDLVLFAYENEEKLNLSDVLKVHGDAGKVAIIVGAEGGFSGEESLLLIGAGAKCVSLGNRILRAETASIALSAVVAYSLGEWDRKDED